MSMQLFDMKKTLALAALLASGAALAAPTTGGVLLTADAAVALAREAMSQCRAQGHAVSAAVVDRSGNLLAMARHEMAGPHTISSSQRKAFTAASTGQDTGKLAAMVAEKPALAGLRDMHDNLLLLPGGLPVVVDGVRVAGLGVGGAPGGHLDAACAEAALAGLQ